MKDSPTSQSSSPPQAIPAGTPATDEHLMLAFSLGSSDAFNELFLRYKQPIYGFFRRRTADPSHAEELTQETFFALLRSASRYEPRALFRTYLYAIAFKILRTHRHKSAFRATYEPFHVNVTEFQSHHPVVPLCRGPRSSVAAVRISIREFRWMALQPCPPGALIDFSDSILLKNVGDSLFSVRFCRLVRLEIFAQNFKFL
jgi:Sigma-70 region 2